MKKSTFALTALVMLLLLSALFQPAAFAEIQSRTRGLAVFEQTNLAHVFYASAKAKKYYYCDDDPQWQDLSPKYLLKFNSEAEAKQATGMVLHRPCNN